MKKFISIGLAASLAFAGCSTDETNVSKGTITGESAAYMNVRIVDVAGTRATAGDFELGTAEEQDVLTADFYFYDEAGNFVTTANVWDGGTSGSFENGNVEFNGNTVVALKGLTDTSLPKYVVTILNRPAAFTHGNTLDEMQTLLSNEAATDGGFKNGKYFIMTTSSYVRSGDEKYFVTALDDSNFVTDPGDIDDAKRVTIYVERLAAKIKVTFTSKEGVDGALVPVEGKDDTFEMKMTVAGDPNQAGSGSNIGSEKIHIHFLGWALNATTKKSYMMKNIKTSWTDDELGFTFPWSEANNHRSYWGMSYNYGKTEELNYANADTDKYTAIASPIYCAENTNTSAVVTANPENTITSALLFAEVTDVDGTALDLVRYNGIYYKEAHYIAYVFNNLKRQEALNYYIATVEGDATKYTQISDANAELVGLSSGLVNVKLTLATTTPLYKKLADSTYELIEADANGKTAVEQANDVLAGFNATNEALAYKGGLMYYNIPIQHFNNNDKDAAGNIPEAKYGVVRNHVYALDVTSIKSLGMGVFDPDEEIIPDDPFNEDKLYQVGANIKILSWKVVNQNVEL